MSLYFKYLKEKTDKLILEVETGFAIYSYPDEHTVYIEDLYILPEWRKSSHASLIANEIADLARAKGCTKMLGSVIPSTKNSTASLSVLISYGMKLDSATNNFILMSKGL